MVVRVKCARLATAADLFLVHFESVSVLHIERLRVVGRLDTLSIEEEAHTRNVLALTVAKGVHELLQLSGSLDLEEDLIVVVRNLDIKVLRLPYVFWLLHIVRAAGVGHGGGGGRSKLETRLIRRVRRRRGSRRAGKLEFIVVGKVRYRRGWVAKAGRASRRGEGRANARGSLYRRGGESSQ